METFKNYGFLIEDAQFLSADQYDDIKGSICQICASIEYALQLHRKNLCNFVISFPLPNSASDAVVHFYNNQPYFYIHKNGVLKTSGSSTELQSFINTKFGSIMSQRCYNFTQSFLSGKMEQSQIVNEKVLRLIKERELLLSQFEHQKLTPKELHNYAQTYFNDELYSLKIAQNPNTHPKTLWALAHSPFEDVRVEIAKHPKADVRILNILLNTPKAVPYIMQHPAFLQEPPTLHL